MPHDREGSSGLRRRGLQRCRRLPSAPSRYAAYPAAARALRHQHGDDEAAVLLGPRARPVPCGSGAHSLQEDRPHRERARARANASHRQSTASGGGSWANGVAVYSARPARPETCCLPPRPPPDPPVRGSPSSPGTGWQPPMRTVPLRSDSRAHAVAAPRTPAAVLADCAGARLGLRSERSGQVDANRAAPGVPAREPPSPPTPSACRPSLTTRNTRWRPCRARAAAYDPATDTAAASVPSRVEAAPEHASPPPLRRPLRPALDRRKSPWRRTGERARRPSRHHRLDPNADRLATNKRRAMLQARTGVWTGPRSTVQARRFRADTFESFTGTPHRLDYASTVCAAAVQAIVPADGDALWVSIDRGLFRRSPSPRARTPAIGGTGRCALPPFRASCGGVGTLWMSVLNQGLRSTRLDRSLDPVSRHP